MLYERDLYTKRKLTNPGWLVDVTWVDRLCMLRRYKFAARYGADFKNYYFRGSTLLEAERSYITWI